MDVSQEKGSLLMYLFHAGTDLGVPCLEWHHQRHDVHLCLLYFCIHMCRHRGLARSHLCLPCGSPSQKQALCRHRHNGAKKREFQHNFKVLVPGWLLCFALKRALLKGLCILQGGEITPSAGKKKSEARWFPPPLAGTTLSTTILAVSGGSSLLPAQVFQIHRGSEGRS